jgi:hypothetical protein
MRFSLGIITAATGAMLLTGVLTLSCIVGEPPQPRPVSFSINPAEPPRLR